MYMINLRADGIDGNAFAEQEQLFDLSKGGQIKQISEAKLMQAVEQKNILILLHGFNRPIADVLSFYVTLEQYHQESLSGHYDDIIGFIWPGRDSKSDYYHSTQDIRKTGSHFRDWINRLNNVQCTIDLLSKGMGSLVVYYSDPVPEDFTIRNIFSMGAGIPQELLTNTSNIDKIRDRVKHIYVFYIEGGHSPDDKFSKSRGQKPLINSERIYWEKKLAQMNNVNLINITEQISNYSSYSSLKLVTEIIDLLLSPSPYPLDILLEKIEEGNLATIINKRSALK